MYQRVLSNPVNPTRFYYNIYIGRSVRFHPTLPIDPTSLSMLKWGDNLTSLYSTLLEHLKEINQCPPEFFEAICTSTFLAPTSSYPLKTSTPMQVPTTFTKLELKGYKDLSLAIHWWVASVYFQWPLLPHHQNLIFLLEASPSTSSPQEVSKVSHHFHHGFFIFQLVSPHLTHWNLLNDRVH